MKSTSVSVYTRVSTKSTDQLNSLENQQQYFLNYIKSKDNFKLFKLYADKGLTATSFKNRPSFYEMLYDAGIDIKTVTVNGKKKDTYFVSNRDPKFTYILCKNTSRFARNILSVDIIRELRLKGVYVYFMSINKSTKDMSDDFLITLLSLLDEQDSKDKSEKVSFGMMQSAKNGVINVSNRMYGYKLVKGETPSDNKLVAVENEAEIVRRIFEMYSTGIGIRKIEDELQAIGVKGRNGNPISRSSIKRIIDNEKFMGVLVRNKYYTGKVLMDKHYPKLKPKEEWIYHEDANIEPIISKELFDRCQAIKEGKINYQHNVGKNNPRSIFAELLVCSKCGSYYIRNSDKGRPFYNCSKKKRFGLSVCDNKNISEKVLKRKIHDYINKENKINKNILSYVNILENYIDYLNNKMNIDEDVVVKEKTKELNRLEIKLERMKELYMDGDIEKEDYIDKRDNIECEIKQIKYDISNIDKYNYKYRIEKEKAEEIILDLKRFDISIVTTEEEFFNNIQFISVNEKGKLDFEFAVKKLQKEFINKALKTLSL